METPINAQAIPEVSLPARIFKGYGAFETRLMQLEWIKGLVLLAVRFWLAKFFFFSGLTKIASWPTTVALFQDEYKVPVLPPEIAAYMSASAELCLPVLLILGLFTRFAAAGFFVMTTVIAVFVYPEAPENAYILLLAAVLIVSGSGKLGADWWIARKA